MKVIIITFCILWTSANFAKSLNPSKMVTDFIRVYAKSNKIIDDNAIVSSSRLSSDGEMTLDVGKVTLPKLEWLKILNYSGAVFRVIPEHRNWAGTAFHLGDNLVLTNQHVLSGDDDNIKECNSFSIYANNGDGGSSKCKKVLWCDKEVDGCLIEVTNFEGYKRDCFFCKRKKFSTPLNEAGSLKLNTTLSEKLQSTDTVLTAIGFTQATAIHASQGRGLEIDYNKDLIFFTPISSGNSGGPLISPDGSVIGVIKQETETTHNNDAYNVAIDSKKIVGLIRAALSDDKVMLDLFNQAVIE